MHLSSLHKYVIISITYLTPKPRRPAWDRNRFGFASGGWRRSSSGDSAPTPFPDDASNQATFNLYMNITAAKAPQK